MNLLNNRRNLAAAVLAAFGTPYVVNETDVGRQVWHQVSQVAQAGPSVGGGQAQTLVSPTNDPTSHPLYQTEKLWKPTPTVATSDVRFTPPLVGGPIHDLRDVMRFDVNPTWVLNHFARVTTVLADLHLDGLRVPIVTGTNADDLAGTLTYYFDRQHRVQRINLHGFTGDPERLVNTMQQHYGMRSQPSLGAGTYAVQWNGKTTSLLQLVHAPVVHADALNAKYTVFVELNQPSMPYGLSTAAENLVAADKHTYRW
jgi:hypothetical protein